jgi:hypothetical protein
MLNEEEDILKISEEQLKETKEVKTIEQDASPNNDPYRDLEKNELYTIKVEENILNLYLNSIIGAYNQIKNEIVNPNSNLRQNTKEIKKRVILWLGIKEENKKY